MSAKTQVLWLVQNPVIIDSKTHPKSSKTRLKKQKKITPKIVLKKAKRGVGLNVPSVDPVKTTAFCYASGTMEVDPSKALEVQRKARETVDVMRRTLQVSILGETKNPMQKQKEFLRSLQKIFDLFTVLGKMTCSPFWDLKSTTGLASDIFNIFCGFGRALVDRDNYSYVLVRVLVC